MNKMTAEELARARKSYLQESRMMPCRRSRFKKKANAKQRLKATTKSLF
jgi:hypothetical protein